MPLHAPPPSLLTPTTVYSLLSTLVLLIAALALARLALPTNRYRDSVQRSVSVLLGGVRPTARAQGAQTRAPAERLPRSRSTARGRGSAAACSPLDDQ